MFMTDCQTRQATGADQSVFEWPLSHPLLPRAVLLSPDQRQHETSIDLLIGVLCR